MPNCRPNLSQLVTVNNEDLYIFKLDTTNRTINFAARHFFMVFMVLFPLQSSCHLRRTHPRIYYSALHNDMTITDRYVPCPWCCNVVEDAHVEIDIDSDIDLTAFQEVPLVSCTEHENNALQLGVLDAIRAKVRAVITAEHLNPDNPINIEMATTIIVNDAAKYFNQLRAGENRFYTR